MSASALPVFAADPNAYTSQVYFSADQTLTTDPGCPQQVIDLGACSQIVTLGWVAFGGDVKSQRWESRVLISSVEAGNPTACSIHANVKIFDPKPLPAAGGSLNAAKQLLVNYIDNRGNNSDRAHPKASDAGGIVYDLKNGESATLTLLSSTDNPLAIKGGSLVAVFTASPDCLKGRVRMEVNYLAEQPIGYTFNVFQTEPFPIAPRWFVSAEGSPQDSPAGFVDMSVNVFNPSSFNSVTVHMVAYDQFGRLVAFTGTNAGVKSTIADHLLEPMESWSTLLSTVLGSAISNFSGRIYITADTGPLMVVAFRRVGLGMSAPVAVPTLY